MLTPDEIADTARAAGLDNRPVVIHSSFRSFGGQVATPASVIDALLQINATVVMPFVDKFDPILTSAERRTRVGPSLWRVYDAVLACQLAERAIRDNPEITHCGRGCNRCASIQ